MFLIQNIRPNIFNAPKVLARFRDSWARASIWHLSVVLKKKNKKKYLSSLSFVVKKRDQKEKKKGLLAIWFWTWRLSYYQSKDQMI